MQPLDHERVREVLDYNPETGTLTWLVRTSIRIMVGDVAGCRTKGYLKVGVDGQPYRAHILIWFWVHGEWPDRIIDHIDGDPFNNRWSNLRLSTKAENAYNSVTPNRNNTSGFRGVVQRRDPNRRKTWMAKIMVNGRTHVIGTYDTPEEASAAYWAAKAELHGEETYRVRLEREGNLR